LISPFWDTGSYCGLFPWKTNCSYGQCGFMDRFFFSIYTTRSFLFCHDLWERATIHIYLFFNGLQLTYIIYHFSVLIYEVQWNSKTTTNNQYCISNRKYKSRNGPLDTPKRGNYPLWTGHNRRSYILYHASGVICNVRELFGNYWLRHFP
jgi:hypothetical protein